MVSLVLLMGWAEWTLQIVAGIFGSLVGIVALLWVLSEFYKGLFEYGPDPLDQIQPTPWPEMYQPDPEDLERILASPDGEPAEFIFEEQPRPRAPRHSLPLEIGNDETGAV